MSHSFKNNFTCYLQVKVRARLSRPRQRGRSGKHARGGYSIGRSIGHGGRSSWSPAISRMDSSRYAGRSGHVVQSHSALGSGFKRPLAPRDRYLVVDVVDDRIGSRRRMPPPERSLGRRSPGIFLIILCLHYVIIL